MKSKKKIEHSFEDSEYLSSTSLSSGSDEQQHSTELNFVNTSSFNVPTLLNFNQPPLAIPDLESPIQKNYGQLNILASSSTVPITNIKNKLSLFQQFPLNNASNTKLQMNTISTVFGIKSSHNGNLYNIDGNYANAPPNKDETDKMLSQSEDEIHSKIIKKDSPIILGDLVTENSSNAVDNKLINNVETTIVLSESNSDLSFNGRIDSLNSSSNNNFHISANANEKSPDILPQIPNSPIIIKNCKFLNHDVSKIMYTNEKSPDLFEDEDDDLANRENGYSIASETTLTTETCEGDDVDGNHAKDDKSCSESLSESFDENRNKTAMHIKYEEILLKRLQMSLTGVLPPPSMTISQINITKMIQLYKDNNEKYIISSTTKREDQVSSSKDAELEISRPPSLLTPSHTIEETVKMEWPQLKEIKNHGIHYNRSKFSERFENLSLRYVDRYIGAETSSSFSMPASPTSAKKRNLRMKLLAKSPGNRLSHLARRRAIFSSENLAGQSSKSILNSTLDSKRQILLDPKKTTRNSRKTLTPKRRTPGRRTPGRKTPSRRTPSGRTPSRRTSGCRKTPLSKSKKNLSKNLFGISNSNSKNNRTSVNTSDPVLRETSKRALFQSPPKSKPIMAQITPEVANRVQKSKRVLFTPEKISRSSSMTAVNSIQAENSEKNKLRYSSLKCLNELNENTTAKLSLKRKRTDYDDDNNENKLTPNSLKFVKSQSFCANTENKNPESMGLISSETGRNLFYRSTSEIIPSSSSGAQSTSSQLSEHHRKKLFWAVSHALQMKQINVKHANFKQYASVLARVTKRLYLEYEEQKSGSTSEKMMKLTSRLVFYVIQGKGVDEIYEIESKNLENAKNRLERSQQQQQQQSSIIPFYGEAGGN